jgi:hypothetical protein
MYVDFRLSSPCYESGSLRPLTAVARFRCRSVHFKRVVDRVALGHVFLQVLGFSPVYIILSVLHTRLYLHVAVNRKENGAKLGNLQDARLFRTAKSIKQKLLLLFFPSLKTEGADPSGRAV